MDTSDLIGKTFLIDKEDGQKHRARIVEAVKNHEDKVHSNNTQFRCSINDDQYEELLSHHQVMEHLEQQTDEDVLWQFEKIIGHQGPLKPNDPHCKGSNYNVMMKWSNGEITYEPLNIIAADSPVVCARCAKDHGLLNLPGWKRFRRLAGRQDRMLRMTNQAKLRSFRTSPRYKHGHQVPRDYDEALRIDRMNGNTKWQDSIALELLQIASYHTFKDLGFKAPVPDGCKRIRVHFVFDVKHDGRHKSRLVADGHLTDIPVDSVCSSVVSLRGLRLVAFIAELNGLQLWATDIGNAYLEAETKEKLCITAGPEFGKLQGHTLVIHKALCGLRTSGLRWHARFADCLRDMGFQPCRAEPDVWMRKNGESYEYVATHVDDLAFAMKDPQSFVDTLKNRHGFQLKGTGPITCHLGANFERDQEGVLCMMPKKCIERVCDGYERMFGEKPSTRCHSPLEANDHPELDASELLDEKGIQSYQSLVGSLQWAVSLGRFDIATATMTLSSYRSAPRRGHLERAKRVVSYLNRMKNGIIRFRTHEPDYSDLPDPKYEWETSVHGDVTEELPADAPSPLGPSVTLTHFVDANLHHDQLTGRSVTGMLHLINGTPIDWFSKKQATVETATYGSEFCAARTCVEQIMDLRNTLRYLGVNIRSKSIMFGDNKAVVDSSSKLHAKLNKRHTALSFHRVREAIAAGIVAFHHVNGFANPADILSKHWSCNDIWKLLRPLMFWQGDTANIDA